MVDFKVFVISCVLLGLVFVEAKSRHKRQTWGRMPTFHLSDGVPVNQRPPANPQPAHALHPPPPPPPPPSGNPANPWESAGHNWDFNMMGGGMDARHPGSGGNTAIGQNGWDHPPQNHWNHPPPPQQLNQQDHPPLPPQNNWNHPPPPPPNHWLPPPQNNWAPPPPPPHNAPNSGVSGSGGGMSAMAGALATLTQQMQMQTRMGVDTPDAMMQFNPAPIEILQYTCPPELPKQQCMINTCPLRCKRYPFAKCYINPCGNCGPEWVQNNMKILDCD